jgi:hypothetical protein
MEVPFPGSSILLILSSSTLERDDKWTRPQAGSLESGNPPADPAASLPIPPMTSRREPQQPAAVAPPLDLPHPATPAPIPIWSKSRSIRALHLRRQQDRGCGVAASSGDGADRG